MLGNDCGEPQAVPGQEEAEGHGQDLMDLPRDWSARSWARWMLSQCVVPRLVKDLLWGGKFLVKMVPPQHFPYCRGIV